MRLLILLLLLPLLSFGQSKRVIDGKEYAIMPMDSAATVAYWGEKGRASVPRIQSLQRELDLSNLELDLHEYKNERLVEAQMEYRTNLQNCAADRNRLLQENVNLATNRDLWKDKAKNRGKVLSGIAAAGTIIIAGLIIAN